VKNYKADFRLLSGNPELVYLDSASTSQKPEAVVRAVEAVYRHTNANIHRGIYDLSEAATAAFEGARGKVARFVGAAHESEIIFTSGTTESINLVAYGWARKTLKRGDIIVTSEMEHHSNLVPWMRLREELGIELFYLPMEDDYRLDYQAVGGLDISRVKLLALTHASNVLGTVNPVAEVAVWFRERGAKARLLVDAAQSVPHLALDVRALGVDFLALSSHKMYGPSGVGVLYAKKELLAGMDPMLVGSHMIETVTKMGAVWAEAPDKFEAGTRNIEGVIGLGAAIDYLEGVGMDEIERRDRDLTGYALEQLMGVRGLTLFGPNKVQDRLGVFSFAIDGVHPHDVAEILNRSGVAVRAGHHCAMPLMERLGVPGTVRASYALYNSKDDVDALIRALARVRKTLKV
jgi:cysteine desulfurase / selenocysteine lyase